MGIVLLFFSSHLVVTLNRSRETHGKALIAFRELSLDPLNTSDRADLISSDCGFSLYAHFDSRSSPPFFFCNLLIGLPQQDVVGRQCLWRLKEKSIIDTRLWKSALRWELRVVADRANSAFSGAFPANSCHFLLETRHPSGPWEHNGRGREDDSAQLSRLLLEISIFVVIFYSVKMVWIGGGSSSSFISSQWFIMLHGGQQLN